MFRRTWRPRRCKPRPRKNQAPQQSYVDPGLWQRLDRIRVTSVIRASTMSQNVTNTVAFMADLIQLGSFQSRCGRSIRIQRLIPFTRLRPSHSSGSESESCGTRAFRFLPRRGFGRTNRPVWVRICLAWIPYQDERPHTGKRESGGNSNPSARRMNLFASDCLNSQAREKFQ